MAERTLAGGRIRERRLAKGIRQAELAQELGISPSYLNLIEHNRRRIGGKLMQALARRLDVEPSLLADGAEQEVIARLSSAASRLGEESDPVDTAEFAARFPSWANLVIRAGRRLDELERKVETLTDRLTHDPHLAATLHEVLSTVTAIRSTASILSDTDEIAPEWRDRFHRNMSEDAGRLAEGAQELVRFLEGAGDTQSEIGSPQEEALGFLAAQRWHFEQIERGGAKAVELCLEDAVALKTAAARSIAAAWLTRYAEDAARLPVEAFSAAHEEIGPDPLALAARMGTDAATIMRRLASLPEYDYGLVVCDASGTITLRKPAEGFTIPRFGATCSLWPLFGALGRPSVAIAEEISQPGRAGREDAAFKAMAIAQPRGALRYGSAPMIEATMLLVPMRHDRSQASGLQIGASCRICPRPDCAARREPSIMGAEATAAGGL